MTPLCETLTLDNASLVPYLYGINDAILSEASAAFSVKITARGSILSVTSDSQTSIASALSFFTALYNDIKTRPRFVSPETLKALISRSLSEHAKEHMPVEALLVHTPGRTVSAHSIAQKKYIEAIRGHDLIFATGPAGTGKTFLAVACAVEQFISHRFDRIILCRPAVEAGEKIGFLPGDIKDKVDPYMQPLYDALRETLPAETLARLLEKKTIEIAPLAFMRGRTLKRAFIILDEAQNATHVQMKMFLTRLGEGSKMTVCGDISQIDLPHTSNSGLVRAVQLTRDINGVACIAFNEKDVMRHPLVRKVVEVYAADDANRLYEKQQQEQE